MKNNFKNLSVVFALCMTFVLGSPALAADPVETQVLVENSENTYEPQAISGTAVAIFVGGILAGYVVDGVLIYTTGYSGGEWAAKALGYYFNNPGCENIQITNGGSTYCGAGRTF